MLDRAYHSNLCWFVDLGFSQSNPTDEKPPAAASAVTEQYTSFGEILASVENPKEAETPTQPEVNAPPETDEQRQKRLRKAARRKLRVRFNLEEPTLPHPDIGAEEEVEEEFHQKRDFRDGHEESEGRMFKMFKYSTDLDIEEEEIYCPEPIRDWREPTGKISFGVSPCSCN